MRIHPVQIDFPLSDDGLVDILLVQWRTPVEEEEGLTPAVLGQSVRWKEQILESLCSWIIREQGEVNRPLFILTPEISTPLVFIGRFEELLGSIHRPAVVIAGIEYLDPPKYRELISTSLNPEKELWMQQVDSSERVNAAVILIRGDDGTVSRYVQPKIRPADVERRWRVYGAEHVLLFHHRSHAPGAGLHFCVQICSDFCSATHVSDLREQIATGFSNEDFRLDLTLLLQCNREQEAPQFRDGSNAYFGGPHQRKVRTDGGALLLLNNSSSMRRNTVYWGNSQFRFPYGSWKEEGGEFTYWLAHANGEQWQAATFREPGSSVYWITYKPLYLCDHRPGTGDSQPFSQANCWYIAEVDNAAPSFKPLSAVMHWLETEWGRGADDLKKSLAEQGIKEDLVNELHKSYLESADEWVVALNHNLAIAGLKTLFVCFRKESYPYGTTSYRDTEPKKWSENPEVGKATREMLHLHSMLRIGASSLGTQFNAAPLDARHALLANSIPITYLWGGREMMARRMAEKYRDDLLPPSIRASAQSVVILLMNPRDVVDPDELARYLRREQIDQASTPVGVGTHLQEGGEVTTGERWSPLFLYDHFLENVLGESDANAAVSRLSQVVQRLVERAIRA